VVKGLAETLRLLVFAKYDEIPALRMLRMSGEEIRARAERLRERVPSLEIIAGESVAGGGSTPDQTLPTWLIAVPGSAVQIEKCFRSQDIVGRIEDGRFVLDLRTVFPEEEESLVKALEKASHAVS
jgi:L-seryl-tRNA(Ser) seleniumtransferase